MAGGAGAPAFVEMRPGPPRLALETQLSGALDLVIDEEGSLAHHLIANNKALGGAHRARAGKDRTMTTVPSTGWRQPIRSLLPLPNRATPDDSRGAE